MMEYEPFGLSTPAHRTESGALLSWEIARIGDFLRKRGVLIGECFDSYIVISHPDLVSVIRLPLENAGFQLVLLGATFESIQQVEKLTIGEIRVMEALSPGALIIEREHDSNVSSLSVSVPDDFDLRDICSFYGGTIQAFLWKGEKDLNLVKEAFRDIEEGQGSIRQYSILETPLYEEEIIRKKATVVSVHGPGEISCSTEGAFTLEVVNEASKMASMWEIGEWT